MEQTPAPSRMPHSETSPLVYHEMQNGYPERAPYISSQHMNHSQSPLSIRTNYATPTSHFKVQMWQQPIFDSGVQSMLPSQTPSVMSFPAGSEMSAMSMMDQAELTDIQQQRFDNIPPGAAAIPQLLQVMREGTEEGEIIRALYMIQKIAKLDQRGDYEANIGTTDVIHAIACYLRKRSSDLIDRAALSALFHICSREPGLSLVFSFIDNGGSDIVSVITNKIEGQCSSVKKYAILILHSVLSDKRRHECVELARRSGALRNITGTLQREQSAKLLSVAVDLLRILFEDNKKEQLEFISLNGIPILLNILQVQQYENLLHSVTGVLKQLCNLFGTELVQHKVLIVLSEQLKHPSVRLVTRSLETIRNLSDVCSQEPNQTKVLRNLIRLLGSDNPKIVLFTVQALGNMSANNAANKTFLEANDVVHNLLVMMYRNNIQMQNADQSTMRTMEDLNDAILIIFRHLCCGHSKAEKTQSYILQEPGIFFDQLRTMRPVLIKETLQLLNRLTNLDTNLMTFKTFAVQNEQHMYGFIEQIVYILRVCCNQIVEKNIEIERVCVYELVTFCLSILESLCRDRSILERTVHLLKTHSSACREPFLLGDVFLPVFLLQQTIIDSPAMKRAAMRLIVILVAHPDIVSIFNVKSDLRSYLTHYSNGPDRDLAVLADEACRILMLGGFPAGMNCSSYREKLISSHGNPFDGPAYQQNEIMNTGHHTNYSHYMSNNHGAPRASPVPEPMEGAGEQFPGMSCIDDTCMDYPFATVFNNTAQPSPLYSSPNATVNEVMMNSPNQNQWSSMNPSSSTPTHPQPSVYQRRTHAYPPDPAHQTWDDCPPILYGHSEVAPYNHAYESNRRPEIPGVDLSNNVYHPSHPPSTYYHSHPSHNQYYNRRDSKHNT
ncbi:unnamed protein product [Auanema sp. JU1783]|nr:unnamed protein product [Auanema sp. JU1783]